MIWRLLHYRSGDAFENMALDEAVFRETVWNNRPPTLRFYGWRNPAVSIGYFQDLDKEIHIDLCRAAGVDIVRRITGGKAVYHCDEVTYALAAGRCASLFPDDIYRTYEIVSRCLARGLYSLGIDARLAAAPPGAVSRAQRPSCCFSVPFGSELLVEGKKICGSAQTRTHGGFLQHGSLLMRFDPEKNAALMGPRDPDAARTLQSRVAAVNQVLAAPVSVEALCQGLQRGFVEELGIRLVPEPLTPAEESLAARLVKKYASEAWTRRRKRMLLPPPAV
jgi:lipoate-protein ligase A